MSESTSKVVVKKSNKYVLQCFTIVLYIISIVVVVSKK